MKWTFFLDMDGVVVDILPTFLHVFVDTGHITEEKYKELIGDWPRGAWEVEGIIGMGTAEMWKSIEDTPNFWRNLPEFPYFTELYRELKKCGSVVFLTTPTQDPQCVAQKLGWLQDRLGRGFRNYILTPKKELLAGPDRILIDDREKNVEGFIAAGGCAVAIPRRWNYYEPLEGIEDCDMVDYVMGEIDMIEAWSACEKD